MKHLKNVLGGVGYITPVCSYVEVSSEGILCSSSVHEGFSLDEITNYGSGEENKGWN